VQDPNPTIIDFLKSNLILIGVILIVIFIYLVALIRKRSKQGFLHVSDKKEEK